MNKFLQYFVVFLCMAAALICNNLLNKHISGATGPSWFAAGCSDEAESGGANCEAVLGSPYSYFPPKMSDEPDGKPHIPVAFLGLLYYSVLLIWFIGVGQPSHRRKRLHWIPLLFVGIGLASSIHFTRIMFKMLDEWCTWCLVTHVINLLILLCVLLMWPRKRKTKSSKTVPETSAVSVTGDPHPTGRLLLMTVVAILVVMYGELHVLGLNNCKNIAENTKKNYDLCVAAVGRIKKESELLLRKWQESPKREINIRNDDPIQHTPRDNRPNVTLVVFSDFECPSCGKFAKFAHEKIQPMFDGQLRMVFKHYPIDQSCNPRAGKTMHPHACEGAIMAEAARAVGGNDAFWKAHDYLFAHRHALKHGKITPELLAQKIGVDAQAMKDVVRDTANDPIKDPIPPKSVLPRIHEDIDLAKICEIRGTPAVFLEGKLVDSLAVTEITFWDKIATSYWKNAKIPRPEKTKMVPTTQTKHQYKGE